MLVFMVVLMVLASSILIYVLSEKYNFYGFGNFCALLLCFFSLGFVGYTPDREGYEYWLEFDVGRDFLFNLFASFASDYGYGYQFVHGLFIFLSMLLLWFFVSRFLRGFFLVIIFFLLLQYLYLATQIRFFPAFYSMLIALYFFLVPRSLWAFVFFALLAGFFHISALFLLVYLVFDRWVEKLSVVKLVPVSLVFFFSVAILIPSLFALVRNQRLMQLLGYFDMADYASVLGGLFYVFPVLFSSLTIYLVFGRQVSANKWIGVDLRARFLYGLSVFPLVIIPVGGIIQVIAQRFVMPLFLVQLVFIFYVSVNSNGRARFNYFCLGVFLFLIYFLFSYLFGQLFSGNNVDRTLKVLFSNFSFKVIYDLF